MHQENNDISTALKNAPFLCLLARADRARLAPNVEIITLSPGDTLFEINQDANALFLVLEGEISLDEKCGDQYVVDSGYIGEELILNKPTYTAKASALKTCRLLVIQGENVVSILSKIPKSAQLFVTSYFRHHNQDDNLQVPSQSDESKKTALVKFLGWLLVCTLPFLIYSITANIELSENSRIFISVFSIAINMWAFKLVPDYVAGMIPLLVVLILGIAPNDVVLSGFQSTGFFMAMSIFVLAVIIINSGLVYRITLQLLAITPRSHFAYNIMLTIIGIISTPILPSANGRVSLISPLLQDTIALLHYKPASSDANQLANSAFFGVSLFSSIFLTSKSVNFLLYSILPVQVQNSFQWADWFQAAAVAGLTLLILLIVFNQFCFKTNTRPCLDKNKIKRQQMALGPITLEEYAAILGIVILITGILTTSIHKIKPAWIAFTLMLIYLALGTVSKKSFREKIDWPFLFLLGTLIGLTKTLSFLGLDRVIAEQLYWLQEIMSANIYLFVLILFGFIILLRVALSTPATVVIMASIFLPLAEASGVNMWVIGFIILTLSEIFILPYQSSYYLLFKEVNRPTPTYNESSFLKFNLLVGGFRLLAVYISIPVWQAMELL